IFRDVDIDVHEGEFVALMGRNGSGKTTLLRSVLGFQKPTAGVLEFDGVDRTRMDAGSLRGAIAYVPQQPSSLFFHERLADELLYTARARRVEGDVNELLARVDLGGAAERHPRALSVGDRQRAAIATVLA